jgi:hypothetical protein
VPLTPSLYINSGVHPLIINQFIYNTTFTSINHALKAVVPSPDIHLVKPQIKNLQTRLLALLFHPLQMNYGLALVL